MSVLLIVVGVLVVRAILRNKGVWSKGIAWGLGFAWLFWKAPTPHPEYGIVVVGLVVAVMAWRGLRIELRERSFDQAQAHR